MKMIGTICLSGSLASLMMALCALISKRSMNDREKASPFECGFDPFSSARTPFSLQFFLLAVLFLIFDIEIALMLPIILTLKWSMTGPWIMAVIMFMTILIMGLFYEWKNGMLEWAK